MKRILVIVGSVAAVVAALLVIVPFLVPASAVKDELAAYVKDATGRELMIEGQGRFRLIPSAGVAFERVQLSGPDGNPDTPFLRAEAVTAELSLLSLATGGIVFDALALERAIIDLRRDAQGRVNWEFGEAPPAGAGRAREVSRAGIAGSDARLGIRKITLRDSTLRYHTPESASPLEIDEANLVLRWPAPDSAATLTGEFALRGREITVEAGLETPQQMQDGAPAQLVVDLNSSFAALRFDGEVLPGPSRRLAGTLRASSDAPGELFAAAGASVAPALSSFTLEGQADARRNELQLTELHAAIDDMTARGELVLVEGGERPALSGRLDFDTLDLASFRLAPVPAPTEKAELRRGGLLSAHADTAPPEHNARLGVDGLESLDANLTVTAQTLRHKQLNGEDAAVNARLDAGELTFDLTRLKLYQGGATGRAIISGHDGIPVISAQLDVSDVRALPLLRDTASFDWVSGTLSGSVNLASGGGTLQSIRERLRGEARMRMRDGALEGLDLPGMLSRLQAGDINDLERRQGDQTRFARLAATWTINQGIAETSDLRLEGPFVSADGAGTIDIRAERLDLRLKPRVMPRAGDVESADAIEIPLHLRGPWDDPKIYPDVEEVVKNPKKSLGAAKNFGKAVEQMTGGKVKEDDFRNAIEGLLGGNDN